MSATAGLLRLKKLTIAMLMIEGKNNRMRIPGDRSINLFAVYLQWVAPICQTVFKGEQKREADEKYAHRVDHALQACKNKRTRPGSGLSFQVLFQPC